MRTLGRYELVRPLGEGQRSWEAELVGPAGFRKRVAVRMLRDNELASARSAGMLHHPNLVEVYEVDSEGADWFCSMELVRGGRLADQAPLPSRAVLEAGLQICAALGALGSEDHGRGLAPDAVLVDDGVVKLAVVGSEATSDCSAPEGAVDERSEVWSVGAVLALLATGSADGGLPPGLLGDVLAVCLDPNPARRFASLDELSTALDGIEAVGPGLSELTAGGAGAEPYSIGPRTNLSEVELLEGRADELREVASRLSAGRLITLKGPPGIGKSALALAAARQRLEVGASEVWRVPPGRRSLAEAVAETLGLTAADVGGVGSALAERGELLLLLDPMDDHHAQAGDLADWLGAAPGLRVIATSVMPLRIAGEQIFDVGPLGVDAAVRVLERGTQSGTEALRALARAVDGHPGALEIVVSLLDGRTVDEVLASGLAAEAAGLGELGERLYAIERRLLDWERAALSQLAAIDGSFTLDEAEAVVDVDAYPDAPWSLDVVAALVDRSLVSPAAGDGPPRFRILAPLRAWARQMETFPT